MAELNIFRYYPQNSSLHRMDARIKLISTLLFSITIGLTKETVFLVSFAVLLMIALSASRLPVAKILIEIRYFLFLIIVIIGIHGLSIPGTPWILSGFTQEGVYSGFWFAWRLLLIVLTSIILTGTTNLSSLQYAIQWLLKPLPWIPAARIGTLFNLTFLLIPLIFEQASQLLEAQQARCISGRHNPVRRIIFLTYPLLLQTLLRANEIVFAMESRCYSETRTPVRFKAMLHDWVFLIFSILVSAMALLN